MKGDLGYDNTRVVVPKDILRSGLFDRMNTADSLIKMPQLARNLIDTNAVELMADWINSLPGVPALDPPTINPPSGTAEGSLTVTIQHQSEFGIAGPTSMTTKNLGPNYRWYIESRSLATDAVFASGCHSRIRVSIVCIMAQRDPVEYKSNQLRACMTKLLDRLKDDLC